MKKLFTHRCSGYLGSLWLVKEGELFEEYNHSKKHWEYYDAQGQRLLNYRRRRGKCPIDFQYTDDKTQITPMINGFYGYTTQAVTYGVDGMDGWFGIKRADGTKITEEVFAELTHFSGGLCPVRNKEEKWGCVDEMGTLVLPYQYCEAPQFNHYGVAVGDDSLIDRKGTPLPDTELNSITSCYDEDRYYAFSLLNAEQNSSIWRCGRAEGILIDIYDTKLRRYAIRAVPEDTYFKLSTTCFEGAGEVIVAALALLPEYDSIYLEGKGTILAEKGRFVTVYDYYQD